MQLAEFSRLRGSQARWRDWLLVVSILLAAPQIALSTNDDSCRFDIRQYELQSAQSGQFETLGKDLALGPRLRVGTSVVRFELPPTGQRCWLQIDRTSMYSLIVRVEGLAPVEFDFFRPGPIDRLSAAGFTVAIPPHETPREVVLEMSHLGSISTQITRIDDATLIARERRIIAVHALSAMVPMIMALLMLVFWLRLHDRALVAYIGLLVSIVLTTTSLDGTLYMLPVGTLLAGLQTMAHMLLLSLFGLAIVMFFREFLAPLQPGAEMTTRILAGVFIFTALSSLLNIPVYDALVLHLTLLAILVTVPLLFWQGVLSLRAGNRLAIYFLVGWSLPVLMIPLRLMAEYGLMEWGFWIRYAPRLALMVEALVFALGLADRILRFRIERDRAEQRRLHSEMALSGYRRQVRTDALTGMASRRAMDEELMRWTEQHQAGSVLFIDIDRFKTFNDNFGHAEGDDALRDVARLIRNQMPGKALLARYGGEEMLALLPEMDLETAATLAETIRCEIQSSPIGPNKRQLTVSIGVAERQPDEAAQQTVARADTALYRAKAAGRNRVASEPAGKPRA